MVIFLVCYFDVFFLVWMLVDLNWWRFVLCESING